MANILFSQLTKANTADNLAFITTNTTNNTDFQLEYPNLLTSLRRDILGSEIVSDQIKDYTSEELSTISTAVCDAGSFDSGMDINIDVNNSAAKPFTVSFIKDASYNAVRINFTNETMKLNGSRVGFYATDFYDLMLPNEGVRFLFYSNNVMVLDRMGWTSFASEHLSNATIPGAFALNGATTFDDKWRRLNWISSGTIGKIDDAPYFLSGRTIIDIKGYFPRYDSARGKLEKQAESVPNITGTIDSDLGAVSGAFHSPVRRNDYADGGGGIGFNNSFDASRVNSAYGRRNEVAPQNYATKVQITL
jgi:hypothetical protein